MENAVTPNISISYYMQVYLQRGGIGCSAIAHSELKRFAVVAQNATVFLCQAHYSWTIYRFTISHSTLLQCNLENRVPSLAFMERTSFVIEDGSLLAK